MRNKYCVYTMFMVHRIGGVSKQVQCIVFVLVRPFIYKGNKNMLVEVVRSDKND